MIARAGTRTALRVRLNHVAERVVWLPDRRVVLVAHALNDGECLEGNPAADRPGIAVRMRQHHRRSRRERRRDRQVGKIDPPGRRRRLDGGRP